jgi:hypothetical protein
LCFAQRTGASSAEFRRTAQIIAEFLDFLADGMKPRDDFRFGPAGSPVFTH